MVLGRLFSRIGRKSMDAIISKYLTGHDLAIAKKIVASGIVSIANQSWQVNSTFLEHEAAYPQFYKKKSSTKFEEEIKKINDALKHSAKLKSYEEFALKVDTILPRLFAPKVVGFEMLREAFALQLFARDSIHILCLADPQLGIDTLAADAITYHPVNVFVDVSKLNDSQMLWQGSDGKSAGIIANSHQGIACITHFEKLNEDGQKAILQLIDRGFISYQSEGNVARTPVSARILGVVNPLVDSFVGKDAGLIRQQVPFDFSMTSHFHLTFLIQRNSVLRFADSKLAALPKMAALTEKDYDFLRSFVSTAEDREVVFSKEFQPLIVEWTSKLKSRTNMSYIHAIAPNTIIAVIRLSQARARMKWRNDVTLEDLKIAMDIVQTALEIR